MILAYLAGIIGLGVWFGEDQHNTQDYFLGSKHVPGWGIGLSIVAGVIGGTFVVLSSHGAEQLIVQRVLACWTVADGRRRSF